MLKLSLMGPQGSGKGTQAELLSHHFGLPAITMSTLLKEEAGRAGPDAQRLAQLMKAGKLVPFEVTVRLLAQRLAAADAQKGFILDGFPRDRDQQDAFAKISDLTHVIFLDLTDEQAVERIRGRLICDGCEMVYHDIWNPPKEKDVCDRCGKILRHREDDTPGVIRERLMTYHRETEPVMRHYREQGILHWVDASNPIPVVHAAILNILKEDS
ncbi:nucleoside monophosphate kinase [Candidatus Uhrbacteria bacterium]|nr:nucleoside monophosphate kinase [Candidatus Uhrbacteria bacterium]